MGPVQSGFSALPSGRKYRRPTQSALFTARRISGQLSSVARRLNQGSFFLREKSDAQSENISYLLHLSPLRVLLNCGLEFLGLPSTLYNPLLTYLTLYNPRWSLWTFSRKTSKFKPQTPTSPYLDPLTVNLKRQPVYLYTYTPT